MFDTCTSEEIRELELVSDRIRRGEPVGIHEAIVAIDYQNWLKARKKENSFGNRVVKWINSWN